MSTTKTRPDSSILQALSKAEFFMFAESGHNQQVEEPSKLFALIRKFLKK